ncbi:MAG: MYG1 family protein [Campylobacterota bacterium]|nr:MYG1 family protein [Campylobacterota bacterium]
MKTKNIKQIATHNKIFHADEVTAIALLKIFTEDEIVVHRVDHDIDDFTKYDMVIDIGKKFDGVKHFDHHQYKGGKSSAGLIWEYLGFEDEYPKISKLIKLVDDNDVGIAKAKPFEYSSLLKCYNTSKITSKEQDEAFTRAVKFAMTVLNSMADLEEELQAVQNIVAESFVFNNNPKILELNRFTPHWTTYINGELAPQIKAVVWEDEEEKNYKVKIPPKYLGSFELNGKALVQDSSMEFVHSSGHFAIAKDEDTMKQFLKNQIK